MKNGDLEIKAGREHVLNIKFTLDNQVDPSTQDKLEVRSRKSLNTMQSRRFNLLWLFLLLYLFLEK